jgi:hypothetical protein
MWWVQLRESCIIEWKLLREEIKVKIKKDNAAKQEFDNTLTPIICIHHEHLISIYAESFLVPGSDSTI